MKVLLKENVEKLGERGEIVEVAAGYARNYLLPRNFAVQATETNFKQLEKERERLVRREQAERADLEAAREKLERTSCTLVASASPEGHLYGSVGAREVADAFAAEGFEIDAHHIKIEHPFKETGVFAVDVELTSDLVAQARIWIVAES